MRESWVPEEKRKVKQEKVVAKEKLDARKGMKWKGKRGDSREIEEKRKLKEK